MRLDEYEQGGQALYADFAKAVRAILHAALNDYPSIRRQHIQAREKGVVSLKAKLDASSLSDIETRVKDLAGVRIVLYSNTDVIG